MLESANDEEVLLRAADGTEDLLSPVDDFNHEIVRTCQNETLMALLAERARQSETIAQDAVRRIPCREPS